MSESERSRRALGLEAARVHLRVDDPRRDDAVAWQRMPAKVGVSHCPNAHASGIVHPPARPAGAPGSGRHIVDEHRSRQHLGEKARFARLTDVGALLLAGLQHFLWLSPEGFCRQPMLERQTATPYVFDSTHNSCSLRCRGVAPYALWSGTKFSSGGDCGLRAVPLPRDGIDAATTMAVKI